MGHLEGHSVFVDDQLPRQGTLEAVLVTSPYARAAITGREVSKVLGVSGVRGVILAEDIPGVNRVAPESGDETLLAESMVEYFGQLVAVVVGEAEGAGHHQPRRRQLLPLGRQGVLDRGGTRFADADVEDATARAHQRISCCLEIRRPWRWAVPIS